MSLTGGEPTKHVCHRNPHVPDARTTAPLARFDGKDVLVVHAANLASFEARRSNGRGVSDAEPSILRAAFSVPLANQRRHTDHVFVNAIDPNGATLQAFDIEADPLVERDRACVVFTDGQFDPRQPKRTGGLQRTQN